MKEKIFFENWISQISQIFEKSIIDFQKIKQKEQAMEENFDFQDSLKELFYQKNHIDNKQWYMEDEIRDPKISGKRCVFLKREIDRLNQKRTQIVEKIDDTFVDFFKDVRPKISATLNTESPAWAFDRLSILQLKIFHMQKKWQEEKKTFLKSKVILLKNQKKDLEGAIAQFLFEIATGKKKMIVYRQVKMYNDPLLNPVLLRGSVEL